jgi:signal recognition particle receptor subunit beta
VKLMDDQARPHSIGCGPCGFAIGACRSLIRRMATLSLASSHDDDLEVSDEVPIEREDVRRERSPTAASRDEEGTPQQKAKARHSTGAAKGRGRGRSNDGKMYGQRDNSDHDRYTHVARAVRVAVTPYLPPPLVNAVAHHIDPFLRPYAGDEGTVKVGMSILLAYVAMRVVQLVASRVLGKGRAVQDHDDLHGPTALKARGTSSADYDRTVVMCGPSLSGKTRLLYHICYNENVDTVASLKANVVVESRTRYIDWPGTAKLNTEAFRSIMLQTCPRVVLVLDSTQAVAGAADCVHQIFSILHAAASSSTAERPTLLVLCHKSDLPTAKNPKRMQLQLRGELERLLKSNAAKSAAGSSSGSSSEAPPAASHGQWWPVGEPVDFDAIVELVFQSTTCEGKGCRELVTEYCQTGTLSDAA